MFPRTAKSIVKSLGSRQIHIGEKNFKIALIDGAGEIGKTPSPLSKNSAKPNVVLYDVAAVNKSSLNYNKIHSFCDDQPFKSISSEKLMIAKKSRSTEVNRPNTTINNSRKIDDHVTYNFFNHQENNERIQIEKLVEVLYRLPIAEKASALNGLLRRSEIIPKAGIACSRMRPFARVLDEMGPSSMKTRQRHYADAGIRKWIPDLMYLSFQENDINFILEARDSKKHCSITKKGRIKNSSWSATVVKENNHQSSTSSLNHDKKPARRLPKKFRNNGILSNIEVYCRAEGKPTNWVVPTALSNNKPKLFHGTYNYGRRYISWFPIKTLGAKSDSISLINDCMRKQKNIMQNKNPKVKIENVKSLISNANVSHMENNSKQNELMFNAFTNISKEEKSFIAGFSDNVSDLGTYRETKNKNLQMERTANNIFRQLSSSNFIDHKFENNNEIVTLNRNSKDNTLNIVEEENWIQRASSKIKSIFPELHAKIRSHSTAILDSYCLKNIFANQVILIPRIISNRTVLLAPKDCESKSKSNIRKKIKEFCERQKKKEDDICQKRKKSCKKAETKCQRRENVCEKKETDCSQRKKQTCKEQKKVSCNKRNSCSDKEDVYDCSKTRKTESQKYSCQQSKDDNSCKTSKDSYKKHCMNRKETSCKQQEKDPCEKPAKKKSSCKKYDEGNKCTKDKRYEKDACKEEKYEREEIQYEMEYLKNKETMCTEKKGKESEPCSEIKKKTTITEKKKKDSEFDCPEIKKVEPCEIKKCSTVTKVPSCSRNIEKDEK